ncbi:MAG: hypothetical protein JW757_06600 [Anaerolineales bacterium]|nr:hypothetical protein [Anaerolineales bacterium]
MSSNQVTNAARQINAMTYKDGLVDLLIGTFFTLLALQEPLEMQGWPIWLSYLPSLGAMAVGLVIYAVVKRKVVAPRIGLAKVSLKRNPARRNIFLFAVVLQLITLVIFILASTGWLSQNLPSRPGWLVDAFFAAATFGFFAFMGYTLDAPRFYIYGLVLAGTMMAQVALRGDSRLVAQLPIIFAGLVMVIGGVVALTRFLKDYPVVETEESDE